MSDTNLVEGFLNTFQILSKNEKAIWRYLQTFSKEYRIVFPSHERIAESCGCHKITVCRSVKKFKSWGWLGTLKRAYTSSIYFISECLLSIDTFKSETFKKVNSLGKSEKCYQGRYHSNLVLSFRKNVIEEALTKYVQNLNLSKKDIEILNAKAKENPKAMESAVRDLISLEKKEEVKKPIAVIIARFKHHSSAETVSEEVKHLDIPEKDKIILSKYNATNRASFLFAYEDFKSYSMIKYVGNIAAFITSRFKAHMNGEGVTPKESLESNKEFVKEIAPKLRIPRGIKLTSCNKYIELVNGNHTKTFEYDDKNFQSKLKQAFRKWNITKKETE